mmetsp:Transcript_15761/g.50325  ORF Transcript_15761/g.50325 Transcript_15761/m.50325 type:complete len:98 (+) Transcript_15761:57-350(+)
MGCPSRAPPACCDSLYASLLGVLDYIQTAPRHAIVQPDAIRDAVRRVGLQPSTRTTNVRGARAVNFSLYGEEVRYMIPGPDEPPRGMWHGACGASCP